MNVVSTSPQLVGKTRTFFRTSYIIPDSILIQGGPVPLDAIVEILVEHSQDYARLQAFVNLAPLPAPMAGIAPELLPNLNPLPLPTATQNGTLWRSPIPTLKMY